MARKLENSVRTIENIVNNLKSQVIDQDNLIKGTISTITQDYLDKYRVSEEGVDNNANSKGPGSSPITGYASDRQNADLGFDRSGNGGTSNLL